jgi:RHH-type proline utilization regulon transcriptional repressor/proline dehydrogenase/delta 1-pyrroline-5-carboxylate dehydrogenase
MDDKVFAECATAQSALREAVTAAYRRPEEACVAPLIEAAALPEAAAAQARATALRLVGRLRAKGNRGVVETLLQEYALSSQEGVALMCLAEALLRIPDVATRNALIRDKIGAGDWASHLGGSRSVFVNAATWGLLVTGKLVATRDETGMSAVLARLVARGGEPVVRAGVNIAMRLMGEQFVVGQTIAEALGNSRACEARGYRYSYDMLGEAALTAADADRYFGDYEGAIRAIGAAARTVSVYENAGISIKLSALHPRYCRAQRGRVMAELLPRLVRLVRLARGFEVGVNIDAEEADRLELSLDLLEGLCFEPGLLGWDGIGFVVQAYQKRAPFVVDFLIDLARRSGRRLMVRLVKGAYWDSEIKRAQMDGLAGFPVFTRKVHTDVSYLACAAKLLAAPAEIFPQFATHNAQTVAAIMAMAGDEFSPGQYEFQCLHGMGESLYDEVVGAGTIGRPCRIYAPVGTHETLLAYLVRRLLENGANTSFVNKIADPAVGVEALAADPVAQARAVLPLGAPHERIALPGEIFGPARVNAAGIDLSDEGALRRLAAACAAGVGVAWQAGPILGGGEATGEAREVRNPADARDVVGIVVEATPALVGAAFEAGLAAAAGWRETAPGARAAVLRRAADQMQAEMMTLTGLIVREAGKTLPAAIGEVREAVDFLRYYARQAEDTLDRAIDAPLGVVVAISPWNFPLAIFVGQVAAGLAAGNVVIAKPAGETPLVACAAARILLAAGVPDGVLQVLPGGGAMGAALVADARVRGVVFTGSTEVARGIQAQLATQLDDDGRPIPLIAETGGQNAMVVDSSALLEQAVGDIVVSAFDSAGQRCSALRVLLVQEEIAEKLLTMLRGAMAELSVGRPDRLATDIGPVISAAAQGRIAAHVGACKARGFAVFEAGIRGAGEGFFVAPTVIEIPAIDVLGREVFGPVLHVFRYKRAALNDAIDAVNALGYGLTFGIHSRIEDMIAAARAGICAGNIYVNRNMIGAVVGVQPFGGQRLSGTGPKAGGPLYLRRLRGRCKAMDGRVAAALTVFLGHVAARGVDCGWWAEGVAGVPTVDAVLAGVVGELNEYRLAPRGAVLCRAATQSGVLRQIAAALATGNVAVVRCDEAIPVLDDLPAALSGLIQTGEADRFADVALFEGDASGLRDFMVELAQEERGIVAVHVAAGGNYASEWLCCEQSISVNTAAAGGNASLMTIG